MNIDMPPGLRSLRNRLQQSRDRKPGLRVSNAAASAQATDVWLFDEVGFWGVSAEDFAQTLAGITTPRIVLHVSSPGGDAFDGIAMANTLRNHPAQVDVRIEGLAASAASFIAMAGDTITIESSASVMIHDAAGFCMGDSRDMASMASLLDRISNTIAGIYQARAGGTVEEWRAAMQVESWYSAAEAVAAGLADSIAGQAADEPAEPDADDSAGPSNAFDLTGFKYPGRDAAPAPKLPTAQAEEPGVATVHVVVDAEQVKGAVHAALVDAGMDPGTATDLAEYAAEPPAAPEPTDAPEVAPEAAVEPVETPSRTDAAEAESPATDEDTWGALVARLTSTIAPLDPVGDALASLREAMQ